MPEIAGAAGVVVPTGDPAAFAQAVGRLVADKALRDELAARARAVRFPDPGELVRRIGLVYDEVTR
jgi:glycosyltransferase involved in cell wall biosynthesis